MEVLYYFPINLKDLNQINLSWETSLNIMKCDTCRKNRPFDITLYPPVWKATTIAMHSLHCLRFFRDKLIYIVDLASPSKHTHTIYPLYQFYMMAHA